MATSAGIKPSNIGFCENLGWQDRIICSPWERSCLERDAWDELVSRACEPNPFYERSFLRPSLERYGTDGDVWIFSFKRDGELCGVLPIARHFQYDGWPIPHIGNWFHPNIFFGAPLIACGVEDDFWRALLDWTDENAGLSLFLHLNEIALSGPIYESLKRVLVGDGRPWGIVERKERALLATNLDADSYLAATLSVRKRKDLDRRFRRLAEMGEVKFHWQSGADDVGQWIDEFLHLEASGWKGEAGSALSCDSATEALFRQSITGAAVEDRLARLAMRLDGKPIAMLSTFLTPPGAFGFKTAFDENFSRFAPGLLLEREFLNALDRLEINWCDSCAAPDHSVMNRIWQARRPIGRVSIAIGGPLRRATFRQILRRELSGDRLGANV